MILLYHYYYEYYTNICQKYLSVLCQCVSLYPLYLYLNPLYQCKGFLTFLGSIEMALNGLRNLEIFFNVGFNCTLNLPTLIYSFRLKYGTKDFRDPPQEKEIHSKVYLSFYVGYS